MPSSGEAFPADESATQQQPDISDISAVLPAGRLDADQYSADDLDGATESIFGSGNMAYASLQASQTDLALTLGDAINLDPDNILLNNGITGNGGFLPAGDGPYATLSNDTTGQTDTDRPLEPGNVEDGNILGAEGNFTNTTVGSLGASTLSSDAGSFSGSSGLSLNSLSQETGFSGDANGQTTVNNSNNVTNETVNSNIVNNNINLGDTNLGDIVNHTTNLGDDIVNTIVNGDITETINVITEEITELTDILNAEINSVTNTVNNILQDAGITNILDQTINITNEITNVVTGTVTNIANDILGGPLTIDLTTQVLDTLGLDFHATLYNGLSGQLGTNLVTDNIVGLAGELTGLNIPFAADAGVNVSFNLLSNETVDDGNDISIAGIDTPDIDLAPVENIVGDVDIQVDLPENLASVDTITEGIDGLSGSLDDFDLTGLDDALELIGGQGLEGALEIVAGDNTLLSQDFTTDIENLTDLGTGLVDELTSSVQDSGIIDTIIETVENAADDLTQGVLQDVAIQDLDDSLNIDSAIDLLMSGSEVDSGIGSITDSIAEDTSSTGIDAAWTESIIDDSNSMFGDLVSGIGGEADTLPEPSGTVAEGMGVLSVDSAINSVSHSSLGGLL